MSSPCPPEKNWRGVYHFGNAVDSKEEGIFESKAFAISWAMSWLFAPHKYGFDASLEEEAREALEKKGLFGDGSTCYRPEGLTYAKIWFDEESKQK